MKMTDRELNQILAALRYWQRTVACYGDTGNSREFGFYGIPEEEAIFFEDSVTPLDEEEIDSLCVKLNFEEEKE